MGKTFRIGVSNQITNGSKLADVTILNDHDIFVKLVEEPIEFTCRSKDEFMNEETLEVIFSGLLGHTTVGLALWIVLSANVPFEQSRYVEEYLFVQEMKNGESEVAKAIAAL